VQALEAQGIDHRRWPTHNEAWIEFVNCIPVF
jgi:hypothetical protein